MPLAVWRAVALWDIDCAGRMSLDTTTSDEVTEEPAPRLSRLRQRAAAAWALVRRRLDEAGIEHLYLVLALLWGLTLALLVPPYQVPDEPAHYLRAWSVSRFTLVPGPGQVVTVPENVESLQARLGSAVVDWRGSDYTWDRARRMLWEPIAGTDVQVRTPASTALAVGYVPQALGIDVSRVLGHSPLLGIYFGRIANLLACVALVFVALRLLPSGKPLMAIVALLPMTVAQMASLSPDALAIAGALLFTAGVLRLAQMESIRTRDVVLLAVTAALLLNVKPGYGVLVFLAFMLLPRQFGSVRRYLISTGAVVGSAALVAGLLVLRTPSAPATVARENALRGVDQAAQLHFVLQHPYGFAKVLYHTFETLALPLTTQAYGVLGWLQLGVPIAGMFLMGLAILVFVGRAEPGRPTAWQRVVMLAAAAVFAVTVTLALYVGYTPLVSGTVDGLQGRYFLPALAPVLLAVAGVRLKSRHAAMLALGGVVLLVAVLTIVTVVSYYYG